MQKEKDVAAVINGEKIYEDQVTNYIEGFRKLESSYETNAAWAQYLAQCGYTAESLRKYVLNKLLIPQLIVRQECAKRNITITENELSDALESQKNHYELKYGEDTWGSILSSYGYDEQSWENNEEQHILEQSLMNSVIKKEKPDQEEKEKELIKNSSQYSGKHSYYISFNTFQDAKKFYDLLDKSTSDKLKKRAKKKFISNKQALNAGWNCVDADRAIMTNEYITQLNKLKTNQVSYPLQVRDYYYLILCDKTYTAPQKGESVNLDTAPKVIQKEVTFNASNNVQEHKFNKWLNKIRNSSKIKINEMPQNLPYDVDIPLESTE